MHLKNIERTYAETKSDLTKVQLFREIEPSRTAKASDSIVLCASDVDKVIYSITLEMDQWSGSFNCNVTVLTKYSASCTEAVSMCLNNNIPYLPQKSYPGGQHSRKP